MATLSFKGKSFVQNHHLAVKYHELIPVKNKSLTDKVSLNDNLIIHGDNLKALKALLPTYAGKIQCVYIDPPYNTGKKGWKYNDNVNSPMMQEWLGSVVDLEDQTRHDKWLCMMTPRLKLIRELIADDGVVFISVDDNELYHLRNLLDNEVFGTDNWVGTIVWKNVTDNNPTNVAIEHEYVVCFSKSKPNLAPIWKSQVSAVKDALVRVGKELNDKHKSPQALSKAYTTWFRQNKPHLWPLDRYKYIDEKGVYTGSQSVHNPGREGYRYDVIHPVTKRPCKQPLMGYRFPPETMNNLLSEGKVLFGKDESKIIELKLYAYEFEDKLASVIDLDGRLGAYELRDIFPEAKKVFDNPKPSAFVEHLLSFATDKQSIVLDSFAGSGTTAHAVLNLNKQDKGSRRFILVECEDYADIVTAERVRRIIKGIPQAKDVKLQRGLGGSFSYFELGQPIEMESILEGRNLPTYNDLARYIFYTATGEEFLPDRVNEVNHFIGESKEYQVYLFYKPDMTYLKTTSLTLEIAKGLGEHTGKKKLVFAPTKYLDLNDAELLAKHGLKGIEYCQLPFEIYKLRE